MRARKREQSMFVRKRIHPDWKTRKQIEKNCSLFLGGAATALAQKRDIANFEPPLKRYQSDILRERIQDGVCPCASLVFEMPARRDGGIKDDRHGYLRPSSRQARISS